MSDNQPTVSVIIPCYNQGQYLDEAVNSVLNQTYQDFEIIIINDGSIELETLEIIKDYDKPKTNVIHTENQGVAKARNQGIQTAQGKYIFCLDADDKVGNTYLEQSVKLLEHNDNLGIVYCQAELFGEINQKWELLTYKFPQILLANVIFNAGFFRRIDWEKTGGYNPNMIYGWEDYDFWLSLIELGREVYCIPEVLFFYRQKSISKSTIMNQEQYLYSYCQIYQNHQQLYQKNMSVIFSEIINLRESINDLKEQRDRGIDRIKYLEEKEAELVQAQAKIQGMESSKFWKLRNQWLKVKKFLHLPIEDELC